MLSAFNSATVERKGMQEEDVHSAAPPSAVTDPERWVDEHGDVMFRFALARVRDPSVAQDLVQEAFLAALRSRSSFAGRSSERTWLVGILKHKVIDHLRQVYRSREDLAPDDASAGLPAQFDERGHWRVRDGYGPRDWGSDAAGAIEKKEFWGALERCLQALPARTAGAFTLRELDELETGEICKVLDVSTTNLWVMLHRARTRLRRCLELSWFARGASEKPDGSTR
jgi:RNA polymerase sigma-70 factor (TIGR02943 family)